MNRESQRNSDSPVMNDVNSLSINIAEDRIIATCNQSQIYATRLWGPDLNTLPEVVCAEMGAPLHHGSIGCLATCIWKPIFMTSGQWDRTLRIWNYETEALEVSKEYQEDVYGIGLHPSGLYAVVGFSDKLRFLTILIDDFSNTKEFPIRNCKLCQFSSLGHLFAAANGNIIQVYTMSNLTMAFVLKGHSGKVSFEKNNSNFPQFLKRLKSSDNFSHAHGAHAILLSMCNFTAQTYKKALINFLGRIKRHNPLG